MPNLVTIVSGVSETAGVKFPTFPLNFIDLLCRPRKCVISNVLTAQTGSQLRLGFPRRTEGCIMTGRIGTVFGLTVASLRLASPGASDGVTYFFPSKTDDLFCHRPLQTNDLFSCLLTAPTFRRALSSVLF